VILLSYGVYYRIITFPGRHLLSLRSLKRAKAIDKNDSRYLLLLVEYALKRICHLIINIERFLVEYYQLTKATC
jgi:hypothetical protein